MELAVSQLGSQWQQFKCLVTREWLVFLLEEVNVAPANHNVRSKHTVATEEIVVSLMILLKL